jgi:hypothetical protein
MKGSQKEAAGMETIPNNSVRACEQGLVFYFEFNASLLNQVLSIPKGGFPS